LLVACGVLVRALERAEHLLVVLAYLALELLSLCLGLPQSPLEAVPVGVSLLLDQVHLLPQSIESALELLGPLLLPITKLLLPRFRLELSDLLPKLLVFALDYLLPVGFDGLLLLELEDFQVQLVVDLLLRLQRLLEPAHVL
jgi:hypothetical protein